VTNVYVICGETGDYSDRSDWRVSAFATEREAELEVEALVKLWGEHTVLRGDEDSYDARLRACQELGERLGNKSMHVGWGDPRWWVETIPMRGGQ
jgi:hypothetical protein